MLTLYTIIHRLITGIGNDYAFYKYQVVSDSVVISLLQAAKEITGKCTYITTQ